MFVCLSVVKFVSEIVRKRPRMHDAVLGLARGPPLENALASPLISPTVVNRRGLFGSQIVE